MSSKTTVTHFAKLNDLNYPEWSVIMEAELVWRGLWSVVMVKIDKSGKDKMMIEAELKVKSKWDEEEMTEAWAEMILRVEGGQLSHMQSCDPLEIWQDLQHVHHACGFTTSLVLHRQSFMTKKTMWSILVCKVLIETRWQVCWEIRLTSSKTAITSPSGTEQAAAVVFFGFGTFISICGSFATSWCCSLPFFGVVNFKTDNRGAWGSNLKGRKEVEQRQFARSLTLC